MRFLTVEEKVGLVEEYLGLPHGMKSSGPNLGKWTRGFHQDAIVSVADSAASKAFGER